ncbi:hypothetical protein D3C84_1183550 [compost metagenome]
MSFLLYIGGSALIVQRVVARKAVALVLGLGWHLSATTLAGSRATRREMASGRPVQGAGDLATQDLQLVTTIRVDGGH